MQPHHWTNYDLFVCVCEREREIFNLEEPGPNNISMVVNVTEKLDLQNKNCIMWCPDFLHGRKSLRLGCWVTVYAKNGISRANIYFMLQRSAWRHTDLLYEEWEEVRDTGITSKTDTNSIPKQQKLLHCCTVHLVDSLNITLPTNALIACHLF